MSEKWTSFEKASVAIRKYCAYRERCQSEVYQRLYKMNVPNDWMEELVADLMAEDYLNEWRYAEWYVRSKVNQNGWGRIKISQGLKAKKVAQALIDHAMRQIDEEIYFKKLHKWIETKIRDYKGKYTKKELKWKVGGFCFQKGFPFDEFEHAWESIHRN
ncbi:MAG TPA: regulatory protein RecX [Saprospiraceae bacterium]|nr:regulatory protein RecX [Saprospiraceae bacterium]